MDAALHAEARRFLFEIALFGGLPDATMDRLLGLIASRTFQSGEVICREGDPGRELFVVRAGAVEVQKQARDGSCATGLAQLRTGDCFGEMSLIDIQPRSASVIARETTELYVLTNMDLYQLYEADLPGYSFLLQNICRELSRRLRKADGLIADFPLKARG